MIRTTSISPVSAAVVLLALTGCPGKLESGPTHSCKSYFAALAGYYARCEIFPNRLVPARARFEEACAAQVVAPGASNAAAHLDRCAGEILESSCGALSDCSSGVTTGDLADGAPCGGGFQCNPFDTMGKCVDQLHEGAACNDGIKGSPLCQPPASCIEGKCTVVDPAACR